MKGEIKKTDRTLRNLCSDRKLRNPYAVAYPKTYARLQLTWLFFSFSKSHHEEITKVCTQSHLDPTILVVEKKDPTLFYTVE